MNLLGKMRAEAIGLREKVSAFNERHAAPETESVRVIAYMGQTVLESEQEEERNRDA
jgi:hypothetical protein